MNALLLKKQEKLSAIYSNVDGLVDLMMQKTQVACPVIHRFGAGVYIREVSIPAGTLAVGHHQNFEHMNVMLKGRVALLNEDGSTTELAAPMMFVGKPGRKIGYVHEDMVWLNVYATTETDVEKLEAHYLTKSDSWKEQVQMQRGVKLLQNKAAQNDYSALLAQLGVTEEQVRRETERTDTMTEMPSGSYKFKLGDSFIQGKGVFATADIEADEVIGLMLVNDKRTVLGRYTNHTATPNAKPVRAANGNVFLVAAEKIAGCCGGYDGDEITVNYRETLLLAERIVQEV